MKKNAKESYSLTYYACNGKNRLAERFFISGFQGHLPFLLSGKDAEREEKLELDERRLLFGIILALYEQENQEEKYWTSEDNWPTWLYLLDVLGNGFQVKSPEALFLDSALFLGERNGYDLQRRVLEVGISLIPHSSKIRTDLILCIWNDFEDSPEQGLDHIRIEQLLGEIDPKEIKEEALQAIAYIGFSSYLMQEKMEQVQNMQKNWLESYVKNPVYQAKVQELLAAEKRPIHMFFVDL